MRLRLEEPSNRLRCERGQRRVWRNHRDRLQALVDKSISDIDAHIISTSQTVR